MTAPAKVVIGCWAGAWGDTTRAAGQLLHGASIDYLVSDHLAEVTMALLARARQKDPDGGYVPDVVRALTPLLAEIHGRGVKVISNGGGLNPAGCAKALSEAAARAGVPLRVAYVDGDDVRAQVAALRDSGARDMFTDEPLPAEPLTANAYLGARPIAAALDLGADIVVTGRCVDSALVLGPLMHEFGWTDDDHDLLSAGSLLGHILECGPQSVGGLFTDWWTVPDWAHIGHPIAECAPDGTAVITKPEGTGGLVTTGTVAEQILYEIADPAAYVMADVVCDWRDVRLEQAGPDRVRVSGARGRPPTESYKATITSPDGHRLIANAFFAGADAPGRARHTAHAILERAHDLVVDAGMAPFTTTSVEVIGAGDASARSGVRPDAPEVVVRIGARHPERAALDALARETIPFGLVAQGMTSMGAGRAVPQPVVRLFHALVAKDGVPVTFHLDGHTHQVDVAAGTSDAAADGATLPEPGVEIAERPDHVTVPLRRIAYVRSGDKGNDSNIGVIARRPEFAEVLHEQVTAARTAEVFAPWLLGKVVRYELPGLHAINLVLRDVLGGSGGTTSLRADPQGKSYGAILLDLPVTVPARWQDDGLLADVWHGPNAPSLRSAGHVREGI